MSQPLHVPPPRNPVIKGLIKLQKEEAKAARRKGKSAVAVEEPKKKTTAKRAK